jgi:hypothetical protein
MAPKMALQVKDEQFLFDAVFTPGTQEKWVGLAVKRADLWHGISGKWWSNVRFPVMVSSNLC